MTTACLLYVQKHRYWSHSIPFPTLMVAWRFWPNVKMVGTVPLEIVVHVLPVARSAYAKSMVRFSKSFPSMSCVDVYRQSWIANCSCSSIPLELANLFIFSNLAWDTSKRCWKALLINQVRDVHEGRVVVLRERVCVQMSYVESRRSGVQRHVQGRGSVPEVEHRRCIGWKRGRRAQKCHDKPNRDWKWSNKQHGWLECGRW